MRELLGSSKIDDKERAKLFKKMFGYYNKGIFNMMTNKFKKLFEQDIRIIPWDNTEKKPPRHPMNFKEKVRHMTKMGVKSKYIIEEKSPYVAKNLAKKYDKDTTAFVYVFGAKDAGRLGGSG